MIKKFVLKNFQGFSYFYAYLRHKVLVVLGLSLLIGILDGLGLTMFLPLLKMVSSSGEEAGNDENVGFILSTFDSVGLPVTLLSILLIMFFFFLAKGVVQYLTGIYKVYVQQDFISQLRLKNIQGLNNLSYKYFVMSDVGRIQNTLTGEVLRVAGAYHSYFTTLQYFIMVFIYMGFAFFMNAQFAVLVTVGGILTNFLYTKLYKNTKVASRNLTKDLNIFQSLIIQNVGNYKYLKATGSLKNYGEKLHSSVLEIEGSNKKIGKLSALLTAAREPIVIAVVVLVIYIQVTLLGSDLGSILISLIFFYRALNYLMQMQKTWNTYLSNSGSLENVQVFENELKRNKEQNGSVKTVEPIRELKLKDVSFYYEDTLIVKEANLTIHKNETVAFVGESGSGKTTLVNIFAGLLPVEEGEYLINNENSREYDIASFQGKIGYITQDAVVFNDTLYNNVSFWAEKNKKNFERFEDAIKKAEIEDFIESLPEKEDTVLGNNGISLSGGQKQRVSIARELFKDVEMLILDEATSALDSETEKSIQENIDALKGKYTILIVAHRISTIKNADRIVVMKNGKISDVGSFSELMERSKYFQKLVELQEV